MGLTPSSLWKIIHRQLHREVAIASRHCTLSYWSHVNIAMLTACISTTAHGGSIELSSNDLKQLSVEELMNVEVTSVSKTAEMLGEAAAAVTVVSNEDIERSGATTVPQALRFVPGINVAQQNSNSWAVSSRGFSSINSEKLLVLSDTRSIYTPLYSGVFWDVQDYLMDDIDRIEVIRGPGASLWGSNAVNGVINITTKSAKDTQGTYLEGIAGTEERVTAAARYGGQTDGGVYYRVFGKYFDRDDTYHPNTTNSDDWHMGHGGFRTDWSANAQDNYTVQGDVYSGNIGHLSPSVTIIGRPEPTGALRVDASGYNLLGRWQHSIDKNSDVQLRAYYDHTHRNDPSFVDDLDTLDLDFQRRFPLAEINDITWGANYRYTDNRNVGKGVFAVSPPTSRDQLFSAFAQDQIEITKALHVTIGSKFEHNDFSGFETQPSIRGAWNLSPQQILWAAASRAVRVPTRLERDIDIDVTDPAGNPVVRLLGNQQFHSEKLLAYELGYRWQALPSLFIDVAAFDNHYRDLASLEAGTPFVDPTDGRTVIPIINRNLTDGRAQGVETMVSFNPLSYWRLTANYSYLDLQLDPHGLDLNRGAFLEGSTPRHQFGLRSFLDLPAGLQLDAQLRSLSAIESLPQIVSGEGLAGYTELDARLAWQASDVMRVSLVGQNLLHRYHTEFGTPEARGQLERGVYVKLSASF